MSTYASLKKSNCKNCYKCIRFCPVKSINFSSDQARIDERDCILCGRCFVACPQNAKQVTSELPTVRALIDSGTPVIVSIAPSFVAQYRNVTIATMRQALQRLGFHSVEETAIGATIVKREYERLISEERRDIIISSCCHSVNLLITKHFPNLIPYLADVLSPVQAHCQDIKRRNPRAKTVFIGPCISKKDEALYSEGRIDAVLTYEELTQWLSEENVHLETTTESENQHSARLFPTVGGVLATMRREPGYTYMAIDGPEHCLSALHDLEKGNIHNCFIEMSACIGSCIGGPMLEHGRSGSIRNVIAIYQHANTQELAIEQPPSQELRFPFSPYINDTPNPSEAEIKNILRKMGKEKPEDELNCGTCGYNTCRDKAIAIFQGKAEISMCLPFLKDRAEDFSSTVIDSSPNVFLLMDDNMQIQKINRAARNLLRIDEQANVLGCSIEPWLDVKLFKQVLQSGKNIYDQRVYLDKYNRHVEQTIAYNDNYHLTVCIMRDVTAEEEQRAKKEEIRQRTIEVADRVVEKQMRIVQEIAFLLGETTAETKVALANLKESISNE